MRTKDCRIASLLLLAVPSVALVLPSVAGSRLAASRCATPVAQYIDDEGGSVQGMSDEVVRFSDFTAGGEAATLDPERAAQLVLKSSGMTDRDFVLDCASTSDTELTIEVPPMLNTFEDYFCGLTADSHPAFKMTSPFEGRMGRRGSEPTYVDIKCDPNGAQGELVAYLCFILPEEKSFSTYYKITCNSR